MYVYIYVHNTHTYIYNISLKLNFYFVYVCRCMSAMILEWTSEDNLSGLILSFHILLWRPNSDPQTLHQESFPIRLTQSVILCLFSRFIYLTYSFSKRFDLLSTIQQRMHTVTLFNNS